MLELDLQKGWAMVKMYNTAYRRQQLGFGSWKIAGSERVPETETSV
jgi:hypothetical protein